MAPPLCNRCRTVVWVKCRHRNLKRALSFFSPELVNVVKLLVVAALCNLWVPVRRLGDLFQKNAEQMIENVDASLEKDSQGDNRNKKMAFKQLIGIYINVWRKIRSVIDPLQKQFADRANSKSTMNIPQISLKSWKSFEALDAAKDDVTPLQTAKDDDEFLDYFDEDFKDDEQSSASDLTGDVVESKRAQRKKFAAIPEHIKDTFFTSAKLYFPGYFWVFAFFSSLFCFTKPILTVVVFAVLTLTLVLTERSKKQNITVFDIEVSLAMQLNLLYSCANAVLFEAGVMGALFLAIRYATIPIVVHLTYNSFTTTLFSK